MKNILLHLVLTTFCFTTFAQTDVTLTINHKLGSEDFAMNTMAQNNLGNDFNVTRLQYYISDIVLTHDNGMTTSIPDFWVLVDANNPTVATLGNHNINEVEGVKFNIGVDEQHNHLDPSSYASGHPLAPVFPSMHWGWAAGYRFIAFEGNGGSNLNQDIELHGLGDMNYFRCLNSLTIPANNGAINIQLDADYTRLLENIDVTGGVIVHGDNLQAQDALENARDLVFQPSEGISNARDISDITSFKAFPNPTYDNQVTIELKSDSEKSYRLVLRDLLGRQLASFDNHVTESIVQINLPSVGIYMVELYDENQSLFTQKVISQ